MSLINISYRTNYLHTYFKTTVVIPDEKKASYPTLWLLHGYTGDDSAWIRHINIEKLSRKYGIAFVMPEARNAFYTDSDFIPYYSYFTGELIDKIQSILPIANNRSDSFIAGSSMGGYGALKIGLKNPDVFSKVAALSPITNIENFRNNPAGPMEHRTFDSIFDSQQKIQQNQLENMWTNKNAGQKFMTICGNQDYMFDDNIHFKNFMEEKAGSNYSWHQVLGDHSWDTWTANLETILKWL